MIFICTLKDENLAPPGLQARSGTHPDYVHEDLTVGRGYAVYATAIHADALVFLVQNDSGDASWKSRYLFEPVDARLPPYWEFVSFAVEGVERWERRTFQAIWGYPRLIQDPAHNDRLMGWVPEDMRFFEEEVRRRAEYPL